MRPQTFTCTSIGLVGHNKTYHSHPYCKHLIVAITNVEDVNAYQIVCKLFCVEMWSWRPKLLKLWPNEKQPSFKTIVAFTTKKLKSGMGKSKSMSCEDWNFQFKEMWDLGVRTKFESRRKSNNFIILVCRSNESPKPSNLHPNQRLMYVWNHGLKILTCNLSWPISEFTMCSTIPMQILNVGPTTHTH